ncbi:hypothetical protein [Hyalangium rubrum]|uniref:Uncharacterized protein n=1 Tax=Hyalangium rubrum TaxID=3103134 RepID=A0ABU5H743_9BACT|nr:hypothetical protein [Hyalangium sp. s54d21]MDY7228909.1 hypothetical protein [Hyalangium sp. s54d21]
MAKATTARKSRSVRRQARRVMPSSRRKNRRAPAPAAKTGPLTLGELIAAAFDTAGGEFLEVLRVVSSPQLSKALGRRIVLET